MVAGVDYILNTPEMAAVPCAALGDAIDNIEDQNHAITDAVDFLAGLLTSVARGRSDVRKDIIIALRASTDSGRGRS